MRRSQLGLALAATAWSCAACGEALKKVPAALNPAKAYVLVEYKLQENPLKGFPGSRRTLPLSAGLILARYDAGLQDVRGMGKAKAQALPAGEKAVEPFRNRPIVKGEASRLFLLELEPDDWVVQGFGDTSFSLGSYSFALAPGSVVDLGVVLAERDWAEGQKPADMGDVFAAALAGPFAKRPDVAPMRLTFRPRGAGDLPVPAGLATRPVQPVAFVAGATFGNYLGALVNRIEGVNARLKAGSTAQPPPAPTAQ